MADVSVYMRRADGTHCRGFDMRGCRVLVSAEHGASDDDVAAVAVALADFAAGLDARWTALEERAAMAERRAADAERRARENAGRTTPHAPARLLDTGYVRVDEHGDPWLMSRRERGWGAFGVRCDGWDDLFRRYDVRVTGHGADEHGPWWSVENKESDRG